MFNDDIDKAARSFVWENGELYCKCIPRRRALLRISNSKANPGAFYWTCPPGQPSSGRKQRCESFAWIDALCTALPLTPAFVEERKTAAIRQLTAAASAASAAAAAAAAVASAAAAANNCNSNSNNNGTASATATAAAGEEDVDRDRDRRTPRKSGGFKREVDNGPMDRYIKRGAENSEAGDELEQNSTVTPGTTPKKPTSTTPSAHPTSANQPLQKSISNPITFPSNSQFNEIADDVLQNIDLSVTAATTPARPSRRSIDTAGLTPRILFASSDAASSGASRPATEKPHAMPVPGALPQKPTSYQQSVPKPAPLRQPAGEPLARPARPLAHPRTTTPFRSAAANAIAASINNAQAVSPPRPVVPQKRSAPESWGTSEDSDPSTQDFFDSEILEDGNSEAGGSSKKTEGFSKKSEDSSMAAGMKRDRPAVGPGSGPQSGLRPGAEAQAPPAQPQPQPQPQPLFKKRTSSSSLRRTRSVTFEDLAPIDTQHPHRANTNIPRTGNCPPAQRFNHFTPTTSSGVSTATSSTSTTTVAAAAAASTVATAAMNRPTADLQALNRQNQTRTLSRHESYSEVPPSPSRMTKRFCAAGAGNNAVGKAAVKAAGPSTTYSAHTAAASVSKTPAAAAPTSIIPTPTSAQLPPDAAIQPSVEKPMSLDLQSDRSLYDHTNDRFARRSNIIMQLLKDAPLGSDTLDTVMTFVQGFAQDSRRLEQELKDREREIISLMQRIESKR